MNFRQDKLFKIIYKKRYFYLVFLIIFLFFCSNLYWIFSDTRPVSGEDTVLMQNADFLYLSNSMEIRFVSAVNRLWYPPVIPILIHDAYVLFGVNDNSHLLVNVFFIPVLLFSLFFLGREIYNDEVGYIAVFFLVSFTPIIILSRIMYDQFVLISLFTMNLLLFLKTKDFTNTKYSFLYALSFCLCLLTRYTISAFLIVPILFSFFRIVIFYIKQYKKSDFFIIRDVLNRSLNICILFFLIYLLVVSWYKDKIDTFSNIYFDSTIKKNNSDTYFDKLNIENLICYPRYILFYSVGLINLFLILIAILILVIRNIRKNKFKLKKSLFSNTALLIFIIIISYSFFIFFPKKNTQITIPFLIPLSLIFAYLVSKLKGIIKNIVLLLILFQGLIILIPFESNSFFADLIYNRPSITISNNVDKENCPISPIEIALFNKHNFMLGHSSNFLLVNRDDQQIHHLYKDIITNMDTNKMTSVLFLVHDDYFNPWVLNHYSRLGGSSISSYTFYRLNFYDEISIPFNLSDLNGDFSWLKRFDFLIIPPKGEFNFVWNNIIYENNFRLVYNYSINSQQFNEAFKLVNTYERPAYAMSSFDFYGKTAKASLYQKI